MAKEIEGAPKKATPQSGYDFNNFEKDALTKPRDLAWDNWWKAEKVGDMVQGYIRDVFYRAAEGKFKDQRGVTLEQQNGEMINVGIKRLSFVLDKTDNLRLGDPLTVKFESEIPAREKGLSATKVIAFYGTKLPANDGNKTVKELDSESMAEGGAAAPASEVDKAFDSIKSDSDEIPFD